MRVALYARVSTKQHGQDPNTQLLPLRDFASAKGYDVLDEYVDRGWSGAKERRPQLDRLMADARKRKFDAVIVWRFDRFARSTKHLLTALSEFQSLQVDFVSLSESIDTSTPMGKMVFTVMGALAEFERNMIRERVQAGVDRAKREGKKLGRPRAIVDEVRIQEQVAAGESLHSISKQWAVSRGVIRRMVQKAEKVGVQSPSPPLL